MIFPGNSMRFCGVYLIWDFQRRNLEAHVQARWTFGI
jgi:hypothetical protein